jgi:hypothetical protein
VKLLLEKGADVKSKDGGGQTPNTAPRDAVFSCQFTDTSIHSVSNFGANGQVDTNCLYGPSAPLNRTA